MSTVKVTAVISVACLGIAAGMSVIEFAKEYAREQNILRAETALKQTRSLAACVKDYGPVLCDEAIKNLLARETKSEACRDAQRAIEALTSDSPGRLDDAVKACRG